MEFFDKLGKKASEAYKITADKTGKINIKRDRNTSTLTLITCRHNTDKQIVIILELQNQ